jgi:hypothetical protein|tara:strand:+ start:186 stop:947 length:762 start_codon:yes stop_codon:yes gene_type:complete
MDNLYIFIPTKGRSDNCKTANLIGDYKNLFLVVEPKEYGYYKEKYPNNNILQLPENDKGIIYSRNFIKQYTEEKNINYYWQLDDDISYLYKRELKKLIRENPITALEYCQNYFINNSISVGALEYRQYAWSATKEIVLNSFCDSVVFINNKLVEGMRYTNGTKEDRDFCIQAISKGLKTGRLTTYAFSAPQNGSNKGGLKEIFYDIKDAELNTCKKMVEIWGENICTHIIKKDGRNDLKIHWKNINSNQTLLF